MITRKILAVCYFLGISPAYGDLYLNTPMAVDTITAQEVRSLFMLRSRQTKSLPYNVTIILPPAESMTLRQLATTVLGVSGTSYTLTLAAQVGVGRIPPIWTETDSEVLFKLITTPYSIGFYNDTLSLSSSTGLKRLTILPE